jgi:hypothetical protein
VIFLETSGERVEKIFEKLTHVGIGNRPNTSVRYSFWTFDSGCIGGTLSVYHHWRIYPFAVIIILSDCMS